MAKVELLRNKVAEVKKTEEYYNSIRTNIQFSGANLKTLVLTSVQPNEGKSTTATHLAISFARAGHKTLLIDADIRNSVMSGIFKATGKIQGLTSYLSGNSYLPETIVETNVENLELILAGQVSPNPTNLLQNAHFKQLIETARETYDYVIIDCPPIGLVIDAAIIAQQCDATIMVTEAGAIKRRFVAKAIDQMQQSGAQFLGVILNKVDYSVDGYGAYGAYGGYGGYGTYGQYGQKVEKSRKKTRKEKKK